MIEDPATHAQSQIDCDVIFEATGSRHAVLDLINKLYPGTFEFSHLATIYPSYLFARGTMNRKDAVAFSDCSDALETMLIDYTQDIFQQDMMDFQDLGWEKSAPPFSYINAVKKKDKYAVNLYTQAPKELKDEKDGQRWIQKVVQVYTGNVSHSFEFTHESLKHPEKKVITHVKVGAGLSTPYYFMDEKKITPTVIPVGDAQASLPLVIGKSAILGAKRALALVESITVEEGEIKEINYKTYDTKLKEIMMEYHKLLQEFAKEDERRFNQAYADHRQKFVEAVKISEVIADEKSGVIIAGLEQFDTNIQCVEKFLALPDIEKSDQALALVCLKDCAKRCVAIANHFITELNQPPVAVKYNAMAMAIYEKNFPGLYHDEVLAIYLSLMVIAQTRRDAKKVIQLGDAAHKIFSRVSPSAKDYVDKIIYYQILAELKVIHTSLQTPTHDIVQIKTAIEKTRSLIAKIAENPNWKHEDLLKKLTPLSDQMEAIIAKTSAPNTGCLRRSLHSI